MNRRKFLERFTATLGATALLPKEVLATDKAAAADLWTVNEARFNQHTPDEYYDIITVFIRDTPNSTHILTVGTRHDKSGITLIDKTFTTFPVESVSINFPRPPRALQYQVQNRDLTITSGFFTYIPSSETSIEVWRRQEKKTVTLRGVK